MDQTLICKNCFKDISESNLYYLFNKKASICPKCQLLFDPKFKKFKIDDVEGLTLYDYDVFMKDLIYKLKGCYDFELKDIFLQQYYRELSLLFSGYTMIPAPSSSEDDKKRGFNHVVEIFKMLNLPMTEAFEKTQHFKQSDQTFRDRGKIAKIIKLKEEIKLKNKVLLVDDIYTTGNTMKAMISQLKSKGISNIKVLVLCKTKLEEKQDNHLMQ